MTNAAKQKKTQAATAELVKFNFHGDELDVVQEGGEHFAVLARLCEPLGIDVGGQRRKLEALPWACGKIIFHHDAGGRRQELFCLSLRSIAGWLFTINAGKVAPHLREKLALYQRECADVLADHFLGRRGVSTHEEQLRDLVEGLYLRLEALEGQVSRGPALPGVVSRDQTMTIRARVTELAIHRQRLGYNETERAARSYIYERIKSASEWGGKGARLENMPADRYSKVDVCLDQLESDLAAEERRRGIERRGPKSVALVKNAVRGKQGDLFSKLAN